MLSDTDIPKLGPFTQNFSFRVVLPSLSSPVIPVPVSLRDMGKCLAPMGLGSWAVVMAHHLLIRSMIQPCAGEKCTFGVRRCFPMVTELKLDKFPW